MQKTRDRDPEFNLTALLDCFLIVFIIQQFMLTMSGPEVERGEKWPLFLPVSAPATLVRGSARNRLSSKGI